MKSLIYTGLLILISQFSFSQVDNYQKNKLASETEDALYKKALEEDPNSAKPHWEHANRMAEFTFNAYKNAWKFYNKALEIDSTNAKIYEDYGDYLFNKYDAIDEAKVIYEKGLAYSSDGKSLNGKIKTVNEVIEKRDENTRLRSFGTTLTKEIKHDYLYSNITNFDSLKLIVTDKKSKYFYQNLLDKFMNDKSLNEYETYLLLIGFTQTDDYNPYNYNDLDNLYEIANSGEYVDAINKGKELLKTNPLNPTLSQELMYCYRKTGNTKMAVKYKNRIQQVFNAMIYTGDGTCEKPYVTFWIKEEYNFAQYIGLSPTGQYSTAMCSGGMADKLEVYNQETKEKELIHFNIMPIFKKTMGK